MTSFLRALTPSQQVGLMFVTLFGLLLLATVAVILISLRELPDSAEGEIRRADRKAVQRALRSSWMMAAVFWVSWATGDKVATALFGVVSFFALREFITMSPMRRGDHRSLILAFFVVLPFQFWLTAAGHFDLFTVFIPVYVFLALAVVSALADDPQHFLERNAKLQWGIMVCVYGMSHVPALLLLEFPQWGSGKNAFLVFFLAATVQTGMLVEHFATRQLRRKSMLQLGTPGISSSFSWRAWGAGVVTGGVLGALMAGITPFKPGQALGMALIACAAGSLGHLVMKALKRDRGATPWGDGVESVTGATGLLARVDALCFAAPVFFHSVRWNFGL